MPQIWINQQIENRVPLISDYLKHEEIIIPNEDVKNFADGSHRRVNKRRREAPAFFPDEEA